MTPIKISQAILAAAVLHLSVPAAETSANGDIELARRLEGAFVKVADQASKSVVVITSTTKASKIMSSEEGMEGMEEFEGTPFEFFFRRRGMPMPPDRELDSQGSGTIIRADGYIVTNNHVIDGADKIKVRLKDGTVHEAKVIGSDERTDLAVIKIEAKDLAAATLADSDSVKVGQWAIAIGAPFELDYSFTVGFVSAKGRSASGNQGGSIYEDYIQTDASINPGNSGGPLCDIEGRVMGLNTLIRGLNRGIGFAIPANMVRDISTELIEKGKVVRPWIGVQIAPLSEFPELAEQLKDVKAGVVVQSIYPETPASRSDLKPADVITAVDGVPVSLPRDLQREVQKKKVGHKLSLTVARPGKTLKVAVQTDELPVQPQTASLTTPRPSKTERAFGLTVQTLSKELAERLSLNTETGVVVTQVEPGSVAEEKGMQHGDIITEVNRQPVKSAEDFKNAVAKAESGKGLLLYFKRGDVSSFTVLKESK
jgi:serine protease Do